MPVLGSGRLIPSRSFSRNSRNFIIAGNSLTEFFRDTPREKKNPELKLPGRKIPGIFKKGFFSRNFVCRESGEILSTEEIFSPGAGEIFEMREFCSLNQDNFFPVIFNGSRESEEIVTNLQLQLELEDVCSAGRGVHFIKFELVFTCNRHAQF